MGGQVGDPQARSTPPAGLWFKLDGSTAQQSQVHRCVLQVGGAGFDRARASRSSTRRCMRLI
jgi:hypothetical protein